MRVCKWFDDLVFVKLILIKSNIVRVWVSSGLVKGVGSKVCRKLVVSVIVVGMFIGIMLRNNYVIVCLRCGLNVWCIK